MRRLYEAADRIEAQRLIDHLRDHGIAAVMLGDYLAGGAGELPAIQFPAVWVVEDRDWFLAGRLLQAFKQPVPEHSEESWRCPRCGETVEDGFELCWNCGTERP